MKVAEIKLKYKRKASGIIITTSGDMYTVLMNYWDKGTIDMYETFVLILMSRRNEVLGIIKVSEGGISGCPVDIRKIYQAALLANASSIIVSHNHPSGNLKPSQQDINITRQIKNAGDIMKVKLLDHLIVTSDSYFSMLDEGLI